MGGPHSGPYREWDVMGQFRFELEALLTYRRHQLDQCRRLMAEVFADQQSCQEERAERARERFQLEDDIRQQSLSGMVDVSRMASQRYYLTQLDVQSQQLLAREARIAQQLELCRQAVLQADRAVKALEQLREKRLHEFQQVESKREQRELEESWTATRYSGNP